MYINKKFLSAINFSRDLVEIVKEYSSKMDSYFSSEENKINHSDLYDMYQDLSYSIKISAAKNGLDKK